MLKIVPPHPIESKDIRGAQILKMVIPQSVSDHVTDRSGRTLGYHLSFDLSISMRYDLYRNRGQYTDKLYEKLSIEEHEDRFWREISERTNDYSKAPLYAIDNEISLFERGQDSCWNFLKFTSSDSLIHQVFYINHFQCYHFTHRFSFNAFLSLCFHQPWVELIPGVHTPYSYAGQRGTIFCFHKEDSDLCSINYQHFGKPKFWYGSPDSERDKLQRLIQEIANELNIDCSQYARHKRIIIPPSVLQAHGIKFTRVWLFVSSFYIYSNN